MLLLILISVERVYADPPLENGAVENWNPSLKAYRPHGLSSPA